MDVFIGSSRQALNTAKDLAVIIEGLGHDPLLWTDRSIFRPGKYTFECLEDTANRVHLAIFIFNEDDLSWLTDNTLMTENSHASVVRGNILLEYGLFRGILGKSNVLICVCGNPYIASDLDGVIYVDFNKSSNAEQQIKDWIEGDHDSNNISHFLLPNGDDCLITVPMHNYNMENPDETYTRSSDTNALMSLLMLLSRKKSISINNDNKYSKNIIHIGSPTITPQINRIISDKLNDFKWYVTLEHFEAFYKNTFNKMPNANILNISDDGWEGYKFFQKEFEYIHEKEDWAFILKLNLSDMIRGKKTVYLLFGIGEIGRQAAIETFVKSHKELTNKYKLNDFLIGAKVHKYSNSIIIDDWENINLN